MLASYKAAEKLKEELIHKFCEFGLGSVLTMLTADGAAETLKEELVKRSLEFGLGFRVLWSTAQSGETGFNIRLDNKNIDDEVLETYGIKVFLDPVSAARLKNYELDYIEEPGKRFYLRELEGVKIKR